MTENMKWWVGSAVGSFIGCAPMLGVWLLHRHDHAIHQRAAHQHDFEGQQWIRIERAEVGDHIWAPREGERREWLLVRSCKTCGVLKLELVDWYERHILTNGDWEPTMLPTSSVAKSVSFTNTEDVIAVGNPIAVASNLSSVWCLGEGAGSGGLTNSHVILIGRGSRSTKDWQIVICFNDGTEIRQDLPHKSLSLTGWETSETNKPFPPNQP